jgi:exosortase
MTKKLQIYGLWPHELAFIGLFAAMYYYCGAQFRGSPWPAIIVLAAIIAGIGVLAYRCLDEWRMLPNKFFFFGLTAVWLALFMFWGNSTFGYQDSRSLFKWMLDIYTSPLGDEMHGIFIPFVVLILFWWRRQELVAQPLGMWWPAILLVAFGLMVHLFGFLFQQPRLSVLGFFFGLYGLTGLAWGRYWLKTSFFPFFLFIFCMPLGEQANSVTLPLRLLVSWIVAGIAHLGLSPDLIRQGTQLFDAQHTFAYEVAAACSGIHSLVALMALTIIYGFVCFRSPWKRWVMVFSAIPLAVLGNVVRLCFTIMVAEVGGQSAGKSVETYAGYITFAVALISVFFLGRWLVEDQPKTITPNNLPA